MGRADSPLRDRVIFVVGARRSGTNWVQRVICAHPDVAAVPTETYLFSRGIRPLSERFQHAAPGSPSLGTVYMPRDAFLDATRAFCDQVFAGLLGSLRPGATHICERTPEHATCLDLIGDLYPDARVVHVIRDGRDVARSLSRQDWGPGSARAAAEEWVAHVRAAREAGARLAHYREVRYEEMLADPRSAVPALFAFCGLAAPDAVVEEALREAATPFNVDPNTPVVAAGRWWRDLSGPELGEVLGVAAGLLAELGYLDGPARETLAPAGGVSHGTPTPGDHVPPGRAMPSAAASRRALDVAERLLRAVRARIGVPDGSTGPPLHRRIFEVQAATDAVVAALAARDVQRLDSLLAPGAIVRIVTDSEDRRGRAERGRALLADAVLADPALDGELVRGDAHPAVPTSTLVSVWRTADGASHGRVLTVTEEGGQVTHLTLYQRPPVPASGTRPER
jgi:hypothetical protein